MNTKPLKGDPSEVIQFFPKFELKLLCCRYWWLESWEFSELSFPYWRIYHNNQEGAIIIYDNKEYYLSPENILLIAPNTSYATRLFDHEIPPEGYKLKGGRVTPDANQTGVTGLSTHNILHLFIHFNIGMPYDNIAPGIFDFKINDHLHSKLQLIKEYLNYNNKTLSFHVSLVIKSLISDLLAELPESNWDLISNDHRIINCLRYIEENIDSDLNNPLLAKNASMTTNAFIRLFTNEVGTPVQKYIRNKRIDQACIMLHHSNLSINEVAVNTGFADRYHFSRIFKQHTHISPARYKKEFGMK
ncbi:MAG TPA: AraC family transcriptional regulator [Prolixibacteraceae bacterium]|nr:AraC family transcriptional regulator [Prolixibacteraceae bacterium]